MRFKLKENWFAYFIAGLFAGLAVAYLLSISGKQINEVWWSGVSFAVLFIILSVIFFVIGCRVKKT